MHLTRTSIAVLLALAELTASARLITSTRLDPKTVTAQKRFAFKIDATMETNSIRFSVTVAPNEAAPSSSLDARLMLFDGEGEILCQALEVLQRKNQVVHYEFEVATNYLAQSQFVFRDMGGGSVPTNRVSDSFWFFLKDFVREK